MLADLFATLTSEVFHVENACRNLSDMTQEFAGPLCLVCLGSLA